MAGGFHSSALGQLGGKKESSKDDVSDFMGSMERGDHVEIVALTEEDSQRAAHILQQRQKQSNPVQAYMRNLQCDTGGEAVPGKGDDRPTNTQSPLTRILLNTMPILSWFPTLNFAKVRADMIAGLTVGVMVIPQSMSYANIAGLDYIYGMYSACVPTLIYGLFGQSRQLSVGPVAMVSLLVEAGLRDKIPETMAHTDACKAWFKNSGGLDQGSVCVEEYAELAFLVSFAVGIMQIVGSILKLGFLVSFLGHPVTSGFTSGAAIIIGLSQVKYWLAFKIEKSQFVYITIAEMVKNIGKTKFMPLILGLAWFAFLYGTKKISAKYKKLKLLGPMGPLISCVVGILMVWLIKPLSEDYNVGYVGEVPSGIFPVSITKLNFGLLPDILPTAVSATLIGYMESVAIGKNLAAKHGYEIDAGQEMLALGISNVVGGCFSCYPVTGSFSRSAVMNATGGLTQLGGIISAIIMLLTLLFLTPLFYNLPQFALASIVISSIIPLVAFGEAKRLFRVKRNDFVLWVVAFICTMFLGVLLGIFIAVLLSLIIVIYESVRPQITILWRIPGTTIYRNVKQESSGAFIPNVFICRIGSSLYFANAAFVKDMILAYTSDLEYLNKTEYLILEMTSVISIDSTAAHVIEDIVKDFRSRGVQVAFAMVGNRCDKTMRKADLKSFIGQQWFFPTVDEAVHYCLKHQHAKRLKKNGQSGEKDTEVPSHALDVGSTRVTVATEIGISNTMNHGYTTVFINLAEDVPMIMSEITALFKRNNINIIRAEIEPMNKAKGGAKHTYFVKSLKSDKELTEYEMQRLREDLENVVSSATKKAAKASAGTSEQPKAPDASPRPSATSVDFGTSSENARIQRLEDLLNREQESNQKIQSQLEAQGKRLDAFLTMQMGKNSDADVLDPKATGDIRTL